MQNYGNFHALIPLSYEAITTEIQNPERIQATAACVAMQQSGLHTKTFLTHVLWIHLQHYSTKRKSKLTACKDDF